MYKNGLLLLTTHVQHLITGNKLQRILNNVKKYVSSTLYVHMTKINPGGGSKFDINEDLHNQMKISSSVLPFVSKFYQEASILCSEIDVNILIHNMGYDRSVTATQHELPQPLQCILCDIPSLTLEKNIGQMQTYVSENFLCKDKKDSLLYPAPLLSICCDEESNSPPGASTDEEFFKQDAVVLGGTFDNIHIGHKILLSESLLLARRKVVIGVSNGPLLKRKTLKELILPVEKRKQHLEGFLRTVGNINSRNNKNGVDLIIEEITDPFGPSIVDPDLQAIVVSKETEKGGHLVNEKRKINGLNTLDVFVINKGELLDLEVSSKQELSHLQESKVSSSVCRYNKLGTLLKPVKKNIEASTHGRHNRPYVIGLTGGIASGKSSVAKRLAGLGSSIIDCDKLGHVSYLPGTKGFENVVREFGTDVVDKESGDIDRKALGKLVFGDKNNLHKLNSIVWPEIEELAKIEITTIMKEKDTHNTQTSHPFHVIFLDAAVLLEASWDSFCDEVWLILVPEDEAKTRLMNRNKMDMNTAEKRIAAQMSNSSRLEHANVVLSTLWEPSTTQKQVEKAWNLLQDRLQQNYQQSIRISGKS